MVEPCPACHAKDLPSMERSSPIRNSHFSNDMLYHIDKDAMILRFGDISRIEYREACNGCANQRSSIDHGVRLPLKNRKILKGASGTVKE